MFACSRKRDLAYLKLAVSMGEIWPEDRAGGLTGGWYEMRDPGWEALCSEVLSMQPCGMIVLATWSESPIAI